MPATDMPITGGGSIGVCSLHEYRDCRCIELTPCDDYPPLIMCNDRQYISKSIFQTLEIRQLKLAVNRIAHNFRIHSRSLCAFFATGTIREFAACKATRLMRGIDTVGVWKTGRPHTFTWAEAINFPYAFAVAGSLATLSLAVVAVGKGEREGCCEEEEGDEMFFGLRVHFRGFCVALIRSLEPKGEVITWYILRLKRDVGSFSLQRRYRQNFSQYIA